MAICSKDSGIFKRNVQTDEDKLVSNFSIAIKAVVHVDSNGGGPGLLAEIVCQMQHRGEFNASLLYTEMYCLPYISYRDVPIIQ